MEWLLVELERAAEIRGGATPRRDDAAYWNGDIPWLTPTDLPAVGAGVTDVETTAEAITQDGLESCSASLLPVGTVLFSSRASIGKVGIASVPLATNQGFANLIPGPGVESRYLAWTLHFHSERIAGLAGSTTFKEVTKSALKRFQIPLPPPSEQRRIVEILDQADRLRRLRAEADAKAGRILTALFIRMFGDPATNPMGWPRMSLGSQSTIVTGNTPSTKEPEYYGGSLPWARPADLDESPLVKKTARQLSAKGRTAARIVPANAVLVVCIGATLGKVGLAGVEMAINQQINAVLPSATLIPEFLFVQLALSADRLRARSTKSTLPILNKSQFSSHEVLVPPAELQETFARAARATMWTQSVQATSLGDLDRLFTVLLQRSFSGDLTTSWREAHMTELLQEMEQQAKTLAEAG